MDAKRALLTSEMEEEEERAPADLLSRVAAAQAAYYEANRKKSFFGKNAQKFDCAAQLLQSCSLEDLLRCAVRPLRGGDAGASLTVAMDGKADAVVLDYPLLKSFAHPGNFEAIARRGLELLEEMLSRHGTYTAHINLQGFTASAMDRYRPLVEAFFSLMDPTDTRFARQLRGLYVYFPPSFFETLYTMVKRFISSPVEGATVVIYSKEESPAAWNSLLSNA